MKGRINYIRFTVIVIAVCFVGFFIAHFLVQRTVVHGDSMEPVLSDGDNLLVDRRATTRIRRNDIIVFTYLYEKKTYYIKRVIGLPGETVQITDSGDILIDGKKLDDTYGTEKITDAGLARYPVKLGADEYFVLGDNRNQSEDSRFSDVGNVRTEQIVGRAFFRFFPFNRSGRI
ncbi:MAG: signal peptidase I [Candidatus Weimeria sp.]